MCMNELHLAGFNMCSAISTECYAVAHCPSLSTRNSTKYRKMNCTRSNFTNGIDASSSLDYFRFVIQEKNVATFGQ